MITTETGTSTDIEQVWREFGDQLRTFVRRRVSDADRADDIVGDVLLRIHRNLHTLEDPERLPAWIFQIARNAITDEYRRKGRRDVPFDFADPNMLPDNDDAATIDGPDAVQRELASCLTPMLGRLPASHRRALELTDLGGVSQTEAARREGISTSGMKSRVQRGRKQLADLVRECCTLTLDTRGMPIDYESNTGRGC